MIPQVPKDSDSDVNPPQLIAISLHAVAYAADPAVRPLYTQCWVSAETKQITKAAGLCEGPN